MFSSGAVVPSFSNPGLPAQPPANGNAFEQLQKLLLSSQVNGYSTGHFLALAPSPPQFAPTFPVFSQTGTSGLPYVETPLPYQRNRVRHDANNYNNRRGVAHASSSRRAGSAKKPSAESRKRKRSPSPPQSYDYQAQIEEDIPSIPVELPKFEYIVVDTNCMILALADISSLKQFEYFRLIVPFTVVNELDTMKMQNKDADLRTKAQRAISYLHDQTSNVSAFQWINLQTRDQVYNISHGGVASNYKECNDDRILDCALHAKACGKKVVLLTEDKNLTLKARCNLIEPVNVNSLLAQIPSITIWNEQKESRDIKRRKLSEESPEPQEAAVAPADTSLLGDHFEKIINHLAPRDLLAVQVVSKQLNQQVADADWSSKLKVWSGDKNGTTIPAESQEAKKWYIRWRRAIVPRMM